MNLTVTDALEVADFVTDGAHHAADFAVLAFDKHEFCKAVFQIDVCRKSDFLFGIRVFFVADINAIDELLGGGFRKLPCRPDVVTAWNFVARVRKTVQKFTIIGKEQQSAALQVKPADILQMLVSRGKVIVNGTAALRVFLGADASRRFMEENGGCLPRQLGGFAVDKYCVFFFVHLVAEIGDDFAIDFNAAFGDEGFCGAAACDSAKRYVLVDTHRRLGERIKEKGEG